MTSTVAPVPILLYYIKPLPTCLENFYLMIKPSRSFNLSSLQILSILQCRCKPDLGGLWRVSLNIMHLWRVQENLGGSIVSKFYAYTRVGNSRRTCGSTTCCKFVWDAQIKIFLPQYSKLARPLQILENQFSFLLILVRKTTILPIHSHTT